jgi:hypothetical protein
MLIRPDGFGSKFQIKLESDANSHELADNWSPLVEDLVWTSRQPRPESGSTLQQCFFTFNYLQSGVSCKELLVLLLLLLLELNFNYLHGGRFWSFLLFCCCTHCTKRIQMAHSLLKWWFCSWYLWLGCYHFFVDTLVKETSAFNHGRENNFKFCDNDSLPSDQNQSFY